MLHQFSIHPSYCCTNFILNASYTDLQCDFTLLACTKALSSIHPWVYMLECEHTHDIDFWCKWEGLIFKVTYWLISWLYIFSKDIFKQFTIYLYIEQIEWKKVICVFVCFGWYILDFLFNRIFFKWPILTHYLVFQTNML